MSSLELLDKTPEGLSEYSVIRHLGSGASSDVFQVVCKTNGRPYVLKQMSLRYMTDDEKLRAKQEILVMDGVDHPNVVKFRESFASDDSVNIVMEYCECETLENLIEHQRYEGVSFPEDVLIEWMAELLCALAHIHSKRILHRDLKTSNIFVTKKNHLKLGDFGVCTILTNATAEVESMIGTPLYFAPEVCELEPYDERSDVWSLGIVFYEMCTLRRPFAADNFFSLIQQILTQEVAPFNTGLSGNFEEIVRKMLSKAPADRPTAQELIDVHLEVPLSHPSHPSQKQSRSRLMQQYYGPELKYNKAWPPPTGVHPTESVPWLSNAEDLSKFAQLQRTMLITPPQHIQQQQPPLSTPRTPHTTKPKRAPSSGKLKTAPASKALPTTPRIHKISNIPKSGSNNAKGSATPRRAKPELKKTLSSTSLEDLKRDVLRRQSEMFGEDSIITTTHTDVAPLVIDLHRESLSSMSDDMSSVRMTSSFFTDVALVLDKHTSGGGPIDLNQLDEAVSLLTQYKLATYGRH